MRSVTLTALQHIDEAIIKLMTARLDLREAGCPAVARELTRVIESAESTGAHALRHYERGPERALAKLRSGVDSLHGSHYMSDNNDSGPRTARDASHAGQKRQDSRSLVHHAG